MKNFVRNNWKKLVLAAAVAAGTYYGVPPEATTEALHKVCVVVGACDAPVPH